MKYFIGEVISIIALVSIFKFRSNLNFLFSTPELSPFTGVIAMLLFALVFLVFPACIILTVKPNLFATKNKLSKKEKLFDKHYSFALTGYVILSWILYLFVNRITYTVFSVLMSIALFIYYYINNKNKVGSLRFWMNTFLIIVLIFLSLSLADTMSRVR